MTGTGSSAQTCAARWPVALAAPLAVPHRLERAEIQTRAEVGPLAGQHDGADAGFGLEPLPRRDQAGEHRVVEGVALLRPVQPDVRDAVRDRHRHTLFGHHAPSSGPERKVSLGFGRVAG
jgi:hypothetical protein